MSLVWHNTPNKAFAGMTVDEAKQIREWRMVEERTWRDVAARAAEKFDGDWGGNQLAGLDLCARAGDVLGEVVD